MISGNAACAAIHQFKEGFYIIIFNAFLFHSSHVQHLVNIFLFLLLLLWLGLFLSGDGRHWHVCICRCKLPLLKVRRV